MRSDYFKAGAMVAFLLLISANAQNDPTRNLPLTRSAAFGCTCDSIDGSMKSVAELTAGKTRRGVERSWREDGGLQSRARSRYIFRNCSKIKIDVEFELAPSTPKFGSSPEDKVKTVSKPYLELPAYD
jgi:hypothetical protein